MNKHTSSVSLIDGHIEDAKVIKALKICGNIINADCKECSYEGKNCVVRLIQSTNDLINRLQAKNKELDEKLIIQKGLIDSESTEDYDKIIGEISGEAIKEFAELVKMEFYKEFDELIPSIMAEKIDNLVKEMPGVKEN